MTKPLLSMFLILSLFALACSIDIAKAGLVRVETFAKIASDGSPIEDRIVPVPPFNRTAGDLPWGWIGFNITLPNQGRTGYEAYGTIRAYNEQQEPGVIMRIVNATPGGGFDLLIFDMFSEQAWNASRVYAVASVPSLLNQSQYHDEFSFYKPDNTSKYCVFFRGIKNGTDDFRILITIKEAWYQEEPVPEIPSPLVLPLLIAATLLAVTIFRKANRQSGQSTPR